MHRDPSTFTHESSEPGMTSETLVGFGSCFHPVAHNVSHLTLAEMREATEMLGLGTQELRPQGLQHQAADNDVLYLSRSSKPIRVLGACKK